MRQGVIDYLSSRTNLSVSGMKIDVTAVEFNGNQADATVSFAPKDGDPAAGMSIKYRLEQQGDRWVVKGREESGGSPHGTVAPAAPGVPNPHGSAMPGAESAPGGAKMPSPEDLPPTGKKK